jgi:TonB-linked SusC/RagA family outer membrane protein
MKNKFYGIVVILFCLLVQNSFAQVKQISGTVSDASGPLPGVSVIIKGQSVGTQTDFDGKYVISANVGDVLIFSYVGMTTINSTVGSSNTINIVMKEDLNQLDEVIVVAYGTANKSDYTGSANQIDGKTLEYRPITNASGAIEGTTAGVTVTAASGQPGSGQDIRIRGYGSVGASSSPLYVLNGFPYNGAISNINPADIESISILKDASSTSLYGNKAANGVVMITTKSGKNRKGEFFVNFNSSIVDRSIPEYKRLGAGQYYEIMWEALRNSEAIPGVDSEADVAAANIYASENIYEELLANPFNVPNDQIVGTDGQLNPSAFVLNAENLDWLDAITRVGYRQNYDLNYRGGSDKSDYYVSLGYINDDGYIINSDYERLSARANVNYEALSWLKTGLNMGVTTTQGNQAQATADQTSQFQNPVRFARNMGPLYNIWLQDANGNYILDENGERIYDLEVQRPSGANNGRHIVAETMWNSDLDEWSTINGVAYFEFKLYEGLSLRLNGSYDLSNQYTVRYQNKEIGDGAPAGAAARTQRKRETVGFNQILTYQRTFKEKHNLNFLAGHESNKYIYNYFYGRRVTQIADGNTELVNFVTTTDLTSYQDELTDESFFTRLNYDYDSKYFLSASYRTDGTSKFASDKRWGSFWSIGASWRIDRESFMENVSWVNVLKLRGSFGEIGNNSGISWYAYQGLYNLDYNNQNEPGILQATLPAPNLLWEKSTSNDVGVDFTLFNYRLNGTIEFYNRQSDNLLFNVPLPLSSGSTSIPENVGSMFNKGLEVSLDYDIFAKDDFNWNAGIVLTTIKNEFTKLPQEEIITGSKKLMVGHSIYDYWLRNWYGVDPADGSALYIPTQEAIDNAGADIRQVNGTTVTTSAGNAEYHYAGSAIPKLTGALNNSFTYKGFTLDFMFTYQIGGDALDYNFQGLMSSGDYGNALSVEILDRWQQPGDITDVPRMDPTETSDFGATSDRWLIDASYLNLRRINFRYAFSRNMLDALKVSDLQLYTSAENVFSINNRTGLDVQQEFNGTNSNVYTPSRIITLGVIVKF